MTFLAMKNNLCQYLRSTIGGCFLLALMATSCINTKKDNSCDTDFIKEYGHECARVYNNLPKGASEIQKYNYLLLVKSKESEIRENVGDHYADIFFKAFTDSIQAK